MSKGSELTLCLTSANRDKQAYPSSTDFTLDLKQRVEAQLFVIGSFEWPYSQYLVEEAWNEFAFDVGLSLPQQASRLLRLLEPPQDLVVLPAPYTPVVYVGEGPGDSGLWHVAPGVGPISAHGLGRASLPLLLPSVLLSPTQGVSVLGVPAPDSLLTTPPGVAPGYVGVLACTAAGVRTFTSPQHLADVWNAYFAEHPLPLPFRCSLTYSCAEATLYLTPGPNAVVVEGAGVLQALSFPCAFGPMRLAPMRSTRYPCSIGRRVPIGNYDFGLLRQTTEVLMNPLSQFGSIAPGTVMVYLFGQGSSLPVPVGPIVSYDPKAVALALTQQFDAALLPAGLPSVRFDFDRDAFQIYCPTPFRIFWADTRLAAQLGFDGDLRLDVCHRGAPRHFVPLPTAVTAPTQLCGESTGHLKTLAYCARGRVQMSAGVAATAEGGVLLAPIGSVALEYLVAFPLPAGGYCWALATCNQAGCMPPFPAPLPTDWYTVLTPLLPCALQGDVQGSVVPAYAGAVNLYFSFRPPAGYARLAEIMGFPVGASLWPAPALPVCAGFACLTAPYHACLDGPAYLLLEMCSEHFSATISHRSGEDVKNNIMKIVLPCAFRLERMYPLQKSATGVNQLTSLRIRVYNPDHTLVNLHGRDWSMTATFVNSSKPPRTECP